MFWVRCWSWSVFDLFFTSWWPSRSPFCVAELGPELTLPPAMYHGHVGIHCVLVAVGDPQRGLLRVGCLDAGLEAAGTAATEPCRNRCQPMFWLSV